MIRKCKENNFLYCSWSRRSIRKKFKCKGKHLEEPTFNFWVGFFLSANILFLVVFRRFIIKYILFPISDTIGCLGKYGYKIFCLSSVWPQFFFLSIWGSEYYILRKIYTLPPPYFEVRRPFPNWHLKRRWL